MDDVGDDAEDGAYPEHDGEPVGQFLQESYPGGSLLLLWEFVVAFLKVASEGGLSSESGFQVDAESIA